VKKQTVLAVSAVVAMVSLGGAGARAGSHLWYIHEVFTSTDGSVQFLELHCPPGADFEYGVDGLNVTSLATGGDFTISGLNLAPPTGDRYLLFATARFAELPGAPAPDFIIPPSTVPFIGVNVDETLTYFPAGQYDTFYFAAGQLPVDGLLSLSRDLTTGVNSPTNFAGETGSVDAGPKPVPSASVRGLAAIAVLMTLAGAVLVARRRGRLTARPA
jgi:hypothetical protein